MIHWTWVPGCRLNRGEDGRGRAWRFALWGFNGAECTLLALILSTVSLFGQRIDNGTPAPPMGWNSWDCYGPTVTEREVKGNADYMATHLKDFGWEYIVVDIRWYVENDKAHGYNEKDPIYVMDKYGRFLPGPVRFPSAAQGLGFRPIAEYVHSKGLKFGIHIMRGIPREAVRENTPIPGTPAKAADIYSTDRLCPWLNDMYTVDYRKEGAREYYNSIFELYASWGIDFVKVDDLTVPYHKEEIELIRKAIDNTGRNIVLSTSPGETPPEFADHIKQYANMWRIVGDFWDRWPQLKEHFEVCHRWAPHMSSGHFPDADMLPLGRIGIRAENGDSRMSMFSRDEQITLMTLCAICRSPLMFGGDLPGNDAFTLSLLTNKEVLGVNQHSANNRQLFRVNDLVAWTADDPASGDKYLALFNAQDQEQKDPAGTMPADSATIPVGLGQLGLKGVYTIKDLWSNTNLGTRNDEFAPSIRRHGAGLYRISVSK